MAAARKEEWAPNPADIIGWTGASSLPSHHHLALLLFLARYFLTLRQLAHGRTHVRSVAQRLAPGRSAKSLAVAHFQVSFAPGPLILLSISNMYSSTGMKERSPCDPVCDLHRTAMARRIRTLPSRGHAGAYSVQSFSSDMSLTLHRYQLKAQQPHGVARAPTAGCLLQRLCANTAFTLRRRRGYGHTVRDSFSLWPNVLSLPFSLPPASTAAARCLYSWRSDRPRAAQVHSAAAHGHRAAGCTVMRGATSQRAHYRRMWGEPRALRKVEEGGRKEDATGVCEYRRDE
jgi:hypothetical protein